MMTKKRYFLNEYQEDIASDWDDDFDRTPDEEIPDEYWNSEYMTPEETDDNDDEGTLEFPEDIVGLVSECIKKALYERTLQHNDWNQDGEYMGRTTLSGTRMKEPAHCPGKSGMETRYNEKMRKGINPSYDVNYNIMKNKEGNINQRINKKQRTGHAVSKY